MWVILSILPAGDWTRIYTPNQLENDNSEYLKHRLQIVDANWVAFKVKACNDDHIVLFSGQVCILYNVEYLTTWECIV